MAISTKILNFKFDENDVSLISLALDTYAAVLLRRINGEANEHIKDILRKDHQIVTQLRVRVISGGTAT